MECLRIRRKLNAKPGQIVITLNNLGELYTNLGKHNQAQKYLKEAIEICEKVGADLDSSRAIALNGLGLLSNYQEDYETALMLYTQSLRILPKNHPEVGKVYSILETYNMNCCLLYTSDAADE